MQGQPRKYNKNCKVFHIFAGVIKFKVHKVHKVYKVYKVNGLLRGAWSTVAQVAVKHRPKDTRHFRPYELYELYKPIIYVDIKILSR